MSYILYILGGFMTFAWLIEGKQATILGSFFFSLVWPLVAIGTILFCLLPQRLIRAVEKWTQENGNP